MEPLRSLRETIAATGTSSVDGIRDPDELAEATGGMRSNLIRIDERNARLDAHMTSALISPALSVHHLTYGCAVTVIPRHQTDENFLISLVADGEVSFRYGPSEVPVAGGEVGLIAPYKEFRSQMSADFDQVIVVVDRKRLESMAALLTGGEDAQPLEFVFPQDVATPSTRALKLLEVLALTAAESDDVHVEQRRTAVEQLALEYLLLAIPSVRERIAPAAAAGSRTVREATAYMIAHLAEPLSVTQIAEQVHVSPRALQLAFRKELGETPSSWLRAQRLTQAKRLLSMGDPTRTSVSQIAETVGMHHYSNFSISFRKQFGVSPSAVLLKR